MATAIWAMSLTTAQGCRGLRYCIHSTSLRFISVDELEDEGYGDYLHLFEAKEKV